MREKKKKERFTDQTYTRNYLVRFLWNKVETKTFVLDELKIWSVRKILRTVLRANIWLLYHEEETFLWTMNCRKIKYNIWVCLFLKSIYYVINCWFDK